MNLIQFNEMMSYNDKVSSNLFSQEMTLFNIINGNFKTEEILDIDMNKPSFVVTVIDEQTAMNVKNRLDGEVVPWSFIPLYQINIQQNKNTLEFELIEV